MSVSLSRGSNTDSQVIEKLNSVIRVTLGSLDATKTAERLIDNDRLVVESNSEPVLVIHDEILLLREIPVALKHSTPQKHSGLADKVFDEQQRVGIILQQKILIAGDNTVHLPTLPVDYLALANEPLMIRMRRKRLRNTVERSWLVHIIGVEKRHDITGSFAEAEVYTLRLIRAGGVDKPNLISVFRDN